MKKVNYKKSIPKLIFLVILLAVLFIFYSIGYFPIIGNIIAENALSKYAKATYDISYPIKTSYDWYDAYYESDEFGYHLREGWIGDSTVHRNDAVRGLEDANNATKIFDKNIEFPTGLDTLDKDYGPSITVSTSINESNYEKHHVLGVHIVCNTKQLTKSESLKMPAEIATMFIDEMGESYNFTGIHLNYYDRNGIYQISISRNKKEPLSYEKLLAATEKAPEPETYSSYLRWREKLED